MDNNQEPTLAQILKKAREKNNLDLKQLSDLLKIPVKYLENLEKGKYEKLPGKAYIFGFVNKYAQLLNLNKNELIEQYKKEFSEPIKEAPLPLLRYSRILITPKSITSVVVVVVIIVSIFYFWKQINLLTSFPILVIENPQQDNVKMPNISIQGKTDSQNKLTINDQEIILNEKGEFQKDVMLQPNVVNIFIIKAVNIFGKETTITKNLWWKTNE